MNHTELFLILQENWRKWNKGDRGPDHLSNSDLKRMLQNGQEAEAYLLARGERLTHARVRMDNYEIADILTARKKRE